MGLLDIDICGPSIPKMLGLEGEEVHQSNAGWSPVYVEDNLAVMSIGGGCSHTRRADLMALYDSCHAFGKNVCSKMLHCLPSPN